MATQNPKSGSGAAEVDFHSACCHFKLSEVQKKDEREVIIVAVPEQMSGVQLSR